VIAPSVLPGRARPHPGAFLHSRFLKPLGISQERLAQGLGISRRRVNELVKGKRGVSADTALRLGVFFGTGPELWLSMQAAWELYQAWQDYRR
jgi:addiction module HigA family antidote